MAPPAQTAPPPFRTVQWARAPACNTEQGGRNFEDTIKSIKHAARAASAVRTRRRADACWLETQTRREWRCLPGGLMRLGGLRVREGRPLAQAARPSRSPRRPLDMTVELLGVAAAASEKARERQAVFCLFAAGPPSGGRPRSWALPAWALPAQACFPTVHWTARRQSTGRLHHRLLRSDHSTWQPRWTHVIEREHAL